MMNLAHPGYLWLLLLLIPLIVWYVLKQHTSSPTLLVSTTKQFARLGTSWKVYVKHFTFALQLMAIVCLIIILCRPQTYNKWSTSETEGTDIVLSIDVSTSMLAQDFKPNRFEAAKQVAMQFVNGRETDNVGVVIFAGESCTQMPMTTDKVALTNAIQDIKLFVLEDGTAIGDGIATAINRIKTGKAKSKSIILLTDGSNNRGVIAPQNAAEIARQYGIKIYTVGVGSEGNAYAPVAINQFGKIEYDYMPVVIDEDLLKNIASQTGGKYFRATGNTVLKAIFDEIDQLEKTRIDVRNFTNSEDNYLPWGLALLAIVLINIALEFTVLRRIP